MRLLRRRNTTRSLQRQLRRTQDDLAFAVSALRCHAGPGTIAVRALHALESPDPTGQVWDAMQRNESGVTAEADGRGNLHVVWGDKALPLRANFGAHQPRLDRGQDAESDQGPHDNVVPLRRR